jgi:mannose-6-phosphate isomerase-like protein (cupin superfamily)
MRRCQHAGRNANDIQANQPRPEAIAVLRPLAAAGYRAELNDYQFKIVKIEGDFIWHDHPATDEAFIVLDGELRIDFRDGSVLLGPGEMFVVPKGVEHRPSAAKEVKMMLIEPRGTLNTGEAGGERTARNDVWI